MKLDASHRSADRIARNGSTEAMGFGVSVGLSEPVLSHPGVERPPSGGRLSPGVVVRLGLTGRNPQSARFFFLRVSARRTRAG